MKRVIAVLAVVAMGLAACTKTPTPKSVVRPVAASEGPGGVGGAPSSPIAPLPMRGVAVHMTIPAPAEPETPKGQTGTDDAQARFEAAVTQAVNHLADRQFQQALSSFELAEAIQSTEMTRQTIDRLKRRVELEAAAEQTATDLQTVLEEGKPEDAARLAAEAVQQFAGTNAVEKILAIKRQADALVGVDIGDKAARFERFRKEYESAIKDDNRRAAALALEQALQNGDDEGLKAKYDELTNGLRQYDQALARAAERRKDPNSLDEALTSLQEAQKIWDTPAVRQDIEDLQISLNNRRDRLGVAEFEVRGDIGVPQAGAYIADEILPAFKGRFDIVERDQIAKAIDDLKLQAGGLIDDADARRELGRTARVRYLVVGSVTPVNGITVHARLIDVETGLIVQTSRIVAENPAELTKRLPDLAQDLQLNDEQKQAVDQERANAAKEVDAFKPDPNMELPPPPEPGLKEIPAPIIPPRPKPPAFVEVKPDVFDNLPPPPPAGQFIALPVLPPARDLILRRRAMFVAIELGDNLFRRGRFREAHWHFEFALNLFPDNADVRVRLARCVPWVPPVPVAPIVFRPRIAFMEFLVVGNPAIVPPYLGYWTPECLAPYFMPEFEIVDRAELFWWMGRLGITPLDLLRDPVARLYLGRALNIRYFMFGNLVQTASFNVTTYMVDAEYGFLASGARIHVRNPLELKLRLGELAWLTKMPADERRRIENDNAQWTLLVNDIRQAMARRRFDECVDWCRKALRLRPTSIEVAVILRDAERQQGMMRMQQARAADLQLQHAALLEARRRQLELARAAELARLQAENLATGRAAVDRQRLLRQRENAAAALILQAQARFKAEQYGQAISLYESACSLRPNDDALLRELALARVREEEAMRTRQAELRAQKEAALRQQRELELAKTRARLDQERQARIAAEQARLKDFQSRDEREYERLLTLAQQHSAKQQYEQAVAAAQKARQLKPTPEAERLLSQLLIELARAQAEKKGAAAKADLERQLAAEREARLAAETEARKNRDLYDQLLALGQALLKQERFDDASEQFIKARKIQSTDVVLAGLRQAEVGKARLATRAAEERQAKEAAQRRADDLKKNLADAQTAFAARQFEKAIALFREAKKQDPSNVDAQAGLTKAEMARDQEAAAARRAGDTKIKRDSFQRLLTSGKANLAAKKYAAAVASLEEAVQLFPNDADAKSALAEARGKLSADAAGEADMKAKTERYRAAMGDGRRYMAAKQYDKAVTAFRAAETVFPGDQAAQSFIDEATKLNAAAEKARTAEITQRQRETRKAAELSAALNRLRIALAGGKLENATAAYREAAKLDANHPDVARALADIRKAQEAVAEAKKTAAMKDTRFNDLMTAARALFADKKYDEAYRSVQDAQAVKPDDAAAKMLLVQIQQARTAAKSMDDDKAKAERVRTLVAQARTAMQTRKLAEADKALDQAEAILPRDAGLIQARADLKKLQQQMADAESETRRKQMAYQAAMKSANDALLGKKFDEAAKAAAAALLAMPNDAAALALQKRIDQARAQAGMDNKNRQDFARFMTQGRTALAAKRYAEAIKAFESALGLFPNDAEAAKALADAKKAASTPPPPPPPPAKPPAYTRAMEQGAAQEKAGRYDQALTQYRAAQRALPNDGDADKKVNFCQYMVDGDKALKARKFQDAVRAYDAALKLFPDDATAKRFLQQARMGR